MRKKIYEKKRRILNVENPVGFKSCLLNLEPCSKSGYKFEICNGFHPFISED